MIAECISPIRSRLGEGPVWDPRSGRLWWVDILSGKVHCHHPASGADLTFQFDTTIGCIGLTRSGALIMATGEGFRLFSPGEGTLENWGGPVPSDTLRRFNDGTVSPEGRFLAATMRFEPPFGDPAGQLYVLDGPDGSRPLVEGLCIANGIAFSPDGATLYLSDSHESRNKVWAFDWHGEDGTISNRRLFHDHAGLAGVPDGAAVDEDGGYWFAASHGWSLVRLDPLGRVDRVIEVPVQKPTKPVFGGEKLDILYFTSIGMNLEPGSEARQPDAGGTFALRPGIAGLPPAYFVG